MRYMKLTLFLLSLLLVSGCTSACAGAASVVEATDGKLALTIALVVNAPTPTLAYTLTNNGTSDYETTPVGINYCRPVTVTPDGKEHEAFVWARFSKMPIALKPSQSITWKAPVSFLLSYFSPKPLAAGNYQIFWRVYDSVGVTTTIYKSNTLLLLNEVAAK